MYQHLVFLSKLLYGNIVLMQPILDVLSFFFDRGEDLPNALLDLGGIVFSHRFISTTQGRVMRFD